MSRAGRQASRSKVRRSPGRLSAARRGQRSGGDKRWWIIIAVCVGVLLLLVYLNAFVFKEVDIDDTTGCPTDGRMPEAHTIVLIDETDALSPDYIEYAKDVIYNEYRWLPIGGRMTIRNVISKPDLAEDIVFCRMVDGSSSGGIIDNPRLLSQRFDRIAGQRLRELYEALSVAPEQQQSPIAEFIAITMDRSNFGRNVPDRRLVLLSDMAQHSDIASQYGASALEPDDPRFDQLNRDMSDVQVRIHYLRRPELGRLQNDAHRQFWNEYLSAMGSEDVALGHGLLLGEENRETWSYDGE